MRRLGLATIGLTVAALLSLSSPAIGQTAAEDSVIASGTVDDEFIVFEVDARSGPSGENATGRVTFNFVSDGSVFFDGPVTCLAVNGNVGTMNIQSSQFGLIALEATDNSAAGSPDVMRAIPQPARAPGDCSPLVGFAVTFQVGTGDIVVTDAPPLPTTKEQCREGGWRNYGTLFKNPGDCVSFVATGGRRGL